MAKRLNALIKYRLEKVAAELEDIRQSHSFNKVDDWDLEQAGQMVGDVLDRKGPAKK